MTSKAKTVKEYLAQLPEDRRAAIQTVREVILINLDEGYEEGMQYGNIGYYVPHVIYPAGYHCDPKQPLPFIGLASQKNHMAVYMMCLYGCDEDEGSFRKEWAKTGKKLDMGKCCIRFKKVEDLALDLIGQVIARTPVNEWIRIYETSLRNNADRRAAAKNGKSRTASSAKRPARSSEPQAQARGQRPSSAKESVPQAQSRSQRPSIAKQSAITAKRTAASGKKKPTNASKKKSTTPSGRRPR